MRRAALTTLWGNAKPATWNRNRAAVASWLAWCADRQHWAAPALPAAAQRRRENNDSTKAVSRSRIDRLCRRRDVPLREKTLWRLLYESASRASAVLALNVEDLDLPNKQALRNAIEPPPARLTRGHTEYRRKPSSPRGKHARLDRVTRLLRAPQRPRPPPRRAGRPAPRTPPHPQRKPATLGPPET